MFTSRAVMAHHVNCPDLHAAAFLDEPSELSALFDHGADLNCRDTLKQTPLITATDGASLDIVKLLLDLGVSVNARDEIGQTALAKAHQKLSFFDMEGGQAYRGIYGEIIDLLEKAGATE
ncbi:MAG: ankyrin repeat domain-containing protein [Rhodospirillales bacterium]|nr:ankyrin repeat domain-containing protein [Rhodospirillales bacterium]